MIAAAASQAADNTATGLFFALAICGGLSILKGPKSMLLGWAASAVIVGVIYHSVALQPSFSDAQKYGTVLIFAVLGTLLTWGIAGSKGAKS